MKSTLRNRPRAEPHQKPSHNPIPHQPTHTLQHSQETLPKSAFRIRKPKRTTPRENTQRWAIQNNPPPDYRRGGRKTSTNQQRAPSNHPKTLDFEKGIGASARRLLIRCQCLHLCLWAISCDQCCQDLSSSQYHSSSWHSWARRPGNPTASPSALYTVQHSCYKRY